MAHETVGKDATRPRRAQLPNLPFQNPDKATADGLVTTAVPFAGNSLVIVVTSKVTAPSDLATPVHT